MATLLAPEIGLAQARSILGRASPIVKLGVAVAWLVGLALTVDLRPPLILAVVALVAGIELGGLAPGTLARRIAPLAVVALGIALANLVFSIHNPDPAATEILRLGPLRITAEAAVVAAGLAARIGAILAAGAVFALTTDATRLVDSLVQQARLPDRFAYGALAAYQAVPRLADDLQTIRGARRLRGQGGWHLRLLVGLLVRAIRHADQLAVAMDARGFGSGPRSTYRPQRWTALDALVAGGGLAILLFALAAGR